MAFATTWFCFKASAETQLLYCHYTLRMISLSGNGGHFVCYTFLESITELENCVSGVFWNVYASILMLTDQSMFGLPNRRTSNWCCRNYTVESKVRYVVFLGFTHSSASKQSNTFETVLKPLWVVSCCSRHQLRWTVVHHKPGGLEEGRWMEQIRSETHPRLMIIRSIFNRSARSISSTFVVALSAQRRTRKHLMIFIFPLDFLLHLTASS